MQQSYVEHIVNNSPNRKRNPEMFLPTTLECNIARKWMTPPTRKWKTAYISGSDAIVNKRIVDLLSVLKA